MSWSHHRTNRLVPGIRFASTQSSYMGQQATLYDMFACLILVYIPMGLIPVDSISSTTEGYYQSMPAPSFTFTPVICCSSRWWKPYRTLSISSITNQILLLYKSTDCDTALYIVTRTRTVAPALSTNLATIPHCLRYLQRFRYTASQSILL